jgi:hypothetical protein
MTNIDAGNLPDPTKPNRRENTHMYHSPRIPLKTSGLVIPAIECIKKYDRNHKIREKKTIGRL